MEWLIGRNGSPPAVPTAAATHPRFGLRPFEPRYAALVASWVRSPEEAFQLAPKTPPPLTPEKVVAWAQRDGHVFLCWREGDTEPCGYVELNPLSFGRRQWWLGHCIVTPALRGKGIGRRMVKLVLDEAFTERQARAVNLVVLPDNTAAIRCYRQAGFSERGEVFRDHTERPGKYRMLYMSIDWLDYAATGHTTSSP